MMGRRGFTLVELLVVIAIIGLLISILLPSLSGARDQSKSITCKSHLRTFGTSAFAYAASEADYLCSGQADARENMNLGQGITDLAQTGIDKVGWIADFVNGGYCFPGACAAGYRPWPLGESIAYTSLTAQINQTALDIPDEAGCTFHGLPRMRDCVILSQIHFVGLGMRT